MRIEFDAPLSFAGIVSMIISASTIVSALLSDRMTKRFGTGLVTAASVAVTAIALFLFSISTKFWMLALFAVPYGLGAGGVDAALNNYVALHLKARHMSWLHCMWGVGATVSPYIMSYAILGGGGWTRGYSTVSIIQACLAAVVFISLPLWKKCENRADAHIPAAETAEAQNVDGAELHAEEKADLAAPPTKERHALSLKEIFGIKGAAACFICFFCYCALEQTAMLWASSYMIGHNGVTVEHAAEFAGLFFMGITAGRGINGFLTLKFGDRTLIRAGAVIILLGIVFIVVPGVQGLTVAGFVIIGLGCAPVYPSIIHMTPALFGADKSQAMIGVQMASAYVGSCLAPPLFGLMANHVTIELLPLFLFVFLALMAVMHEIVVKKTAAAGSAQSA